MSEFPRIRWFQQVEWYKFIFVVGFICVWLFITTSIFKWSEGFDECKTVETVGSCTRYDCRVGFTDETNGTLRGPALQGDLVCKYSFRDFWEMPNE